MYNSTSNKILLYKHYKILLYNSYMCTYMYVHYES